MSSGLLYELFVVKRHSLSIGATELCQRRSEGLEAILASEGIPSLQWSQHGRMQSWKMEGNLSPDKWSQYLHSTPALLPVEAFCSFSLKLKRFWFLIPKCLSFQHLEMSQDNGANLCLRWESSGSRWVRTGHTWAAKAGMTFYSSPFWLLLPPTFPPRHSPSPLPEKRNCFC